jgi:hypothetical protein
MSLTLVQTEVGLTGSSGPSDAQALEYLKTIVEWCKSTGYVKKLAWFGAWQANPDGFAADSGRFFSGPSQLTKIGEYYAFGS